jgi:hypothetical protein
MDVSMECGPKYECMNARDIAHGYHKCANVHMPRLRWYTGGIERNTHHPREVSVDVSEGACEGLPGPIK